LEPIAYGRALLAARPAAIQLRDKRSNARATLELLHALRDASADTGVPLVANDRADLAALAACDGLHVGAEDLPCPAARSIGVAFGNTGFFVGVSVHNSRELASALTHEPDYVAFGPVFPTTSKARPDPCIGLDGLTTLVEQLHARRPTMPCVAIGGIELATAAEVGARCGCGAVIGALLPNASRGDERYDEVSRRAATLHEAFLGAF